MNLNLIHEAGKDNGKRRPILENKPPGKKPELKAQPNDVDAEKALLCACLKKPEIVSEVQTLLSPSDFYREAHAHIAGAIFGLGKGSDIVTVGDRLKASGQLEQCGGMEYLSDLQDFVSTSAGWRSHAEIIKEQARRRNVIAACWNAVEQAGSASESLPDILTTLHKTVGALSQNRIAPFTNEQTSVFDFIYTSPPTTEYLLENILPKGVVGAIVGMGGVSKSFFEITLAVGMATGKPVLEHFKPVNPAKVLGLFAEDPDEEIHRRTYFTASHTIPNPDNKTTDLLFDNLHLKSVIGMAKPLMRVDSGGNPVPSADYEWLRKTVEAHKGLEVLVLDPKSRFYGLDENNNDHNTQWVALLEELSREFGLTILFSHHVSKASAGALNQASARGGSALVDACRWVANLRTVDEQTGKKYDLEDFKTFVEFNVTKSNYAPQLPGTIFFKRGEHGVLLPVNLEFQRLKDMAEEVCTVLSEKSLSLTKRELVSQPEGKEIRARLKDRFSKVGRDDLNEAIDYALKEGLLTCQTVSGETNSRGILRAAQ